jgi:hypothetical protein
MEGGDGQGKRNSKKGKMEGCKGPNGFAEESMEKQRGILEGMPLCFLPPALGVGGRIFPIRFDLFLK